MQPCDVTARQSRPVGFYKGGVGVTAVKNVMTTPLMVHTVCDSVHSSRFRLKRMCFMLFTSNSILRIWVSVTQLCPAKLLIKIENSDNKANQLVGVETECVVHISRKLKKIDNFLKTELFTLKNGAARNLITKRRQIDNLSFFSKNHVLRSITINVKNQIYLFE